MLAGIEEKYSQLYNYCYFKLHNAHLAEDITQEAFLRLFENSRYKEIDEYRKKETVEMPKEMPAQDTVDKITDIVAVHMALDGLSEREREIILLRVVNEVPVEDIGKIYGISRFAVYREVKKILKRLERRLS